MSHQMYLGLAYMRFPFLLSGQKIWERLLSAEVDWHETMVSAAPLWKFYFILMEPHSAE